METCLVDKDIFSTENQAESWKQIPLKRIFVIYHHVLDWKVNLIGRVVAEFVFFPGISGYNTCCSQGQLFPASPSSAMLFAINCAGVFTQLQIICTALHGVLSSLCQLNIFWPKAWSCSQLQRII